jgi:hypothetical protein
LANKIYKWTFWRKKNLFSIMIFSFKLNSTIVYHSIITIHIKTKEGRPFYFGSRGRYPAEGWR